MSTHGWVRLGVPRWAPGACFSAAFVRGCFVRGCFVRGACWCRWGVGAGGVISAGGVPRGGGARGGRRGPAGGGAAPDQGVVGWVSACSIVSCRPASSRVRRGVCWRSGGVVVVMVVVWVFPGSIPRLCPTQPAPGSAGDRVGCCSDGLLGSWLAGCFVVVPGGASGAAVSMVGYSAQFFLGCGDVVRASVKAPGSGVDEERPLGL